jgi:hypothetical protein
MDKVHTANGEGAMGKRALVLLFFWMNGTVGVAKWPNLAN